MARAKPEYKSIKRIHPRSWLRHKKGLLLSTAVRSKRPYRFLDDDALWDATTARYTDKLALLAKKALEDYAVGRTTPIDPDTM